EPLAQLAGLPLPRAVLHFPAVGRADVRSAARAGDRDAATAEVERVAVADLRALEEPVVGDAPRDEEHAVDRALHRGGHGGPLRGAADELVLSCVALA